MSARWFPVPADYREKGLAADLQAGLILGILLIPQAMAYGMLAGVAPVYGLYAALVPALAYALLASTPHVNVGPTALASLLCLNSLTGLAEPGTATYLAYAVVLGALTGVLQLAGGLLRLGVVVSLLSRPVLSGFVSAAAVLITVSQVRVLLGFSVPPAAYFHEELLGIFQGFPDLHWPTALLGLGGLAFLFAAKKWLPSRFPDTLVLIALTTLLLATVGQDWGIATVGEIPAALPPLVVPAVDWAVARQLLPAALVLALISFIETVSIGEAFSARHNYYRVRPNRELLALGLSKVAGGFFQAVPSSASFSRSAVVEDAGGRGPLSNLVAVALLLLTLLFFTPAFYHLPVTVLAAIIVFSVRNLFDVAEMRRLWRLAPKEFLTLLTTFLFTLFAGLLYGIAGGVVLSLYFVFARAARPHLAELGRVPGTNAFRNRNRFAAAEIDPAILIVRFDAELYFGNAEYFRDKLRDLADQRGAGLRAVVLDGHAIHDIDSSGLHALNQFMDDLRQRNVELYLCGMIGPVRDMLFKSGLMASLGANHNFLSIQDALNFIASSEADRGWDLPAVQHD
ncbi:sulfate permease [Neolewinella lacunae]|uniref:Sulfate permease n=1 Tax=Neolewinella lacunae TaxID=1517758 RepID=A0A923T8Q5_9BACT|nr:sulfate permease [Neolewinella lacunae]MBC6994781.1 sulfate permease [Neolewinella lacunae]MDN3634403.1 sulfate permease [Neolewinella lacunae]